MLNLQKGESHRLLGSADRPLVLPSIPAPGWCQYTRPPLAPGRSCVLGAWRRNGSRFPLFGLTDSGCGACVIAVVFIAALLLPLLVRRRRSLVAAALLTLLLPRRRCSSDVAAAPSSSPLLPRRRRFSCCVSFAGAVDLRYLWLTGNALSPWPAPNPC